MKSERSKSGPRRRRARNRGRHAEPSAIVRIDQLLADAPRDAGLLIEYLHRIQDAEGCLRPSLLAALADALALSQAEVFEVASFYHHFDLIGEHEPAPPALTVRVCESVSCALAGATALIDGLQRDLGTSLRVQRVPCIGRCDTAPAAVLGRYPIAHATSASVRRALDAGDTECPVPLADGFEAARRAGAYQCLQALVAANADRDTLFARVEASGLRGLGGAGFSAGRKWRIVAAQSGPRMMVVNADEGEPGTFKDRHYLERDPHRMLEGMLIAAWAVGCVGCIIYLRDEYAGVRALLERELLALQQAGQFIAGWQLPSIELRRGAGAYVCGEESAMIESIEGRRGMPRLRPPYIAERGLYGRPTLAHNVETLYWLPTILSSGDAAFAAHGRRGRRGLRSFSVSGRVCDAGVKLAPAGISLRELIDEYCGGMLDGHQLRAFLPGGASGGILPASLADVPLDFDTLQPHGAFIGSAAIVVLSDVDDVPDVALNLMRFFRAESCGQCTPCRVGTDKAVALMARADWDEALLGELSQAMIDASICGLGQAAPNPVLSTMRFFPQALQARRDRKQ